MKTERVRRKFILSAASGIALAMVVGYPVSGWLAEGNFKTPPESGSAAFHLAKAGVDRALWSINRDRASLDALLIGGGVPGLHGETDYRDVPGGVYRVRARYDNSKKQFEIVSTGVEAKSGRTRALRLVLKQEPNEKGLLQTYWEEIPVSS